MQADLLVLPENEIPRLFSLARIEVDEDFFQLGFCVKRFIEFIATPAVPFRERGFLLDVFEDLQLGVDFGDVDRIACCLYFSQPLADKIGRSLGFHIHDGIHAVGLDIVMLDSGIDELVEVKIIRMVGALAEAHDLAIMKDIGDELGNGDSFLTCVLQVQAGIGSKDKLGPPP